MDASDLLPGRILVVDDEQPIHASMRLRLGRDLEMVSCYSGPEALQTLSKQRFDLCFADIHMPDMDGLRFIDSARRIDPQLGYVVVSAYDTDENLRRTIPLQVYDFISKPLPERSMLERRVDDWVSATRQRRREHDLVQQANTLAGELGLARMERDVELVASESTREGLVQIAGLMSTINAHYVGVCSALNRKVKDDAALTPLLRSLEQGRRTAEAAVDITERVLGTAYSNRDSSPALINDGIRDAMNIVARNRLADSFNKSLQFSPTDAHLPLRGISGIGFLLMLYPALAAVIMLAEPNSTISITGEYYRRLDAILKEPKLRTHLWLNRRNALTSNPAWMIVMRSSSPPMTRAQVDQWLKGDLPSLDRVAARGLIEGIQKCHGLLGFAVAPARQLQISLALPN